MMPAREDDILECRRMHNASVSVLDDALAYLARCAGEDEIAKFWRESFHPRVKARLALNWSAEQHVQRFAADHRGHGSELEIIEEQDRYVLKLSPCGSGGELRKRRANLAATRKAYPWSWSRTGIPYYCAHCCIAWELVATELGGYPVRIHLCPERPEEPCINLVYKRPESIPQEYFTRIGMAKGA